MSNKYTQNIWWLGICETMIRDIQRRVSTLKSIRGRNMICRTEVRLFLARAGHGLSPGLKVLFGGFEVGHPWRRLQKSTVRKEVRRCGWIITYQQLFRAPSLIRILDQAAFHKCNRLLGEGPPSACQSRSWFIDDMLQQVKDRHGVRSTALTDTVTSAIWFNFRASNGPRKCRIRVKVGNTRWEFFGVRWIREWETADSQLDKGDTERPDVWFDCVRCPLNPLRLLEYDQMTINKLH